MYGRLDIRIQTERDRERERGRFSFSFLNRNRGVTTTFLTLASYKFHMESALRLLSGYGRTDEYPVHFYKRPSTELRQHLKFTPPCHLCRKILLNNGHIRCNSVVRIQQSAGMYVKRQSMETLS